jgi:osmotically-inducible protein OsmY
MKTNNELRSDVEAELSWSPDLDEKNIAVKADNGVVTLTGYVGSYFEKTRAEIAAKRVAGVAGVANDLEVRLADRDAISDPDLARQAVAAIRLQLPEVAATVKVLVERGQVTLEGEVAWHFQRDMLEDVVRQLRGVLGVANLIRLKPRIVAADIKRSITRALHRSAQLDANGISVEVDSGQIILRGNVRNWNEREEAVKAAWSAPGVTVVRNEIRVSG